VTPSSHLSEPETFSDPFVLRAGDGEVLVLVADRDAEHLQRPEPRVDRLEPRRDAAEPRVAVGQEDTAQAARVALAGDVGVGAVRPG
jgi:hypothetical protein